MKIDRQVFSPIEVNTYILSDGSGDCVIIDCGCYDKSEFSRLQRFLESRNLRPVLLLNTHCHLDHVFGNKFMFQSYNLRSSWHELEEFNRTDAPGHAGLFGLSMDTVPDPEQFLVHNQVIKFGSTILKALHVPGHSPGSIAFYCQDAGSVFTGDALFAGSIGRTDLPGGNYHTLISSIKENLLSLPESTVVYPGHGSETSIGKEMKSNPFLK